MEEEMTTNWRAIRIKEEADEVRRKLRGGTLFGHPIDRGDADAIVLAAYLLGRSEVLEGRERDLWPD